LAEDGRGDDQGATGGKTTGPDPTDRGKAGVTRSVLTEGRGVPIGVAVDGANCHAMNLVRATIERIVVARPAPTEEQPQGMCLDKGYNDDEVRATVREFGFTAHIRRCGEEAKEIAREAGKRARHWAVPRRQRRLNRSHRLLIRWEKKPEHYLAFLHFARGVIALCAVGLFG
jgi:putative transposase